jgi:hypothetical protein
VSLLHVSEDIHHELEELLLHEADEEWDVDEFGGAEHAIGEAISLGRGQSGGDASWGVIGILEEIALN